MSRWPKASLAKGVCDRCGLTFLLNSLRYQTDDGRMTRTLVCETCLDNDDRDIPPFVGADAQALRNARPDTGKRESQWMPVPENPGAEYGLYAWTAEGLVEAALERSVVKYGTASFRLKSIGEDENDLVSAAYPCTLGDACTLDYWRRSTSIAGDMACYAFLRYEDEDGVYVSDSGIASVVPSAINTWEHRQDSITIPSTATIAQLRVVLRCGYTGRFNLTEYAYFDEVNLLPA